MKLISNLVNKHGAPVLLYVILANMLLLGWAYVDSNRQADKRQDAAIQAIKDSTDRLLNNSSNQTKKLDSNDQQLREYGEATLCVLAILRPDAVPQADPVKCRAKLSGINNVDGSFLSGEWPPLPPEPEAKESNSETQNTQNPQQVGTIDRIIDNVQLGINQINSLKGK